MFVVETLGASFPDGSVVKNLPANVRDRGSTDYIYYIIYVKYNIYIYICRVDWDKYKYFHFAYVLRKLIFILNIILRLPY